MELKYLDSLKFYYILADVGACPLEHGWVGGYGWGCGCVGWYPMHACMCTLVLHHRVSQGFFYVGSHLHEIIMFIMHACVCMCVCMCMHTWDTPHPSSPISTHPKGEPLNQLKCNKTWTNQDIFILFKDFGPLHFPAVPVQCLKLPDWP